MNITIERAAALLSGARDVLILTHKRPDGDTVGSAAALCLSLRARGQTACVLENPDITPRFADLIAPLAPPAGFSPAFVTAVDTADAGLLPPNARVFEGRIDLLIDHHRTGAPYAAHICASSAAAATGELVYRVIEALGMPLTPATADALYIAIATDTGCFRFANTTAETFRVAAALLDAGAHASDINLRLFLSKPRTRLALEAAVLGSLRFFAGGRIAGAAISRDLIARTGATEDDLDGISSVAREIEGVEAGITAIERPEGIKISLRTGNAVDASAVCRRFGGGGHRQAAGCTLQGPIGESVELLAAEIGRILDGKGGADSHGRV